MIDLEKFATLLQEEKLLDKPLSGLSREKILRLCAAVITCQRPEDIELLMVHPHLAPCPKQGLWWVYRGQACVNCGEHQNCPSWPSGIDFPTDLPETLKPLRQKR